MASSDGEKRAQLILHDTLGAPGRSVTITAELLEEHFLKNAGVGGEVVLFYVGRRAIGRAMTGGDGRVVKSFVPVTTGVTDVSARLGGSRRVTAGDAMARLFVWEQNRSLILISLHALTPRAGGFGPLSPFSGSKAGLPDPEPEAVKMLSTVGGRHGLIYLIPASPLKLPDVREWSARHRIPAGPIVLVPPGQGFAKELDRLHRNGWRGIKGGLASTPMEAKTLLDRGKRAVASPSGSREKWPVKTVQAQDWEDAGKKLSSA
jgi:hypothetical protein